MSREDSKLVYVSPPPPPVEAPAATFHPLRQLEHSVWTPRRLRWLSRTRLEPSSRALPVKLRLRKGLLLRWAGGILANEPHAAEAWPMIVRTWLAGGNHVAVAEDYFLGRSWAFELVSRYLSAASYYLFADDLRASICRQTHGDAGGRGGAFNRDGAGLFAETCSACVLLRGADWEGWIAIEESTQKTESNGKQCHSRRDRAVTPVEDRR